MKTASARMLEYLYSLIEDAEREQIKLEAKLSTLQSMRATMAQFVEQEAKSNAS